MHGHPFNLDQAVAERQARLQARATTTPRTRRRAVIALLALSTAGLITACQPVPTDCFGFTITKVGTAGNDVITGTGGGDVIVGLGGNDVINGLGGGDIICGGDGNDRIIGAEGVDTIDGEAGSDTVDAGPGADRIFETAGLSTDVNRLTGGPDDDHIKGGPGHDLLVHTAAPGPVSANLASPILRITGDGTDEYDVKVDGVVGGPFADNLRGNHKHNTLDGGPGDDVIVGGLGDDRLTGGAGVDRLSFTESSGAVDANLTTGRSTGNGTDVLSGFEHLDGTDYDDTLTGTAGPNIIDGRPGNDRCVGGGGADTLIRCP